MALKETISYSDGVKGWPSFYSYLPDYMLGMNSFLYTFNNGQLYRHNTNTIRNQYYGENFTSTITSVFNVEPQTIKLFKTMSFESDDAWSCVSLSTEMSAGNMLNTYFEEKESEWFSFIRNDENLVNFKLRSANGIGDNINVLAGPGTPPTYEIFFNVDIGSILSIGDTLYYQATPTSSRIVGVVSSISLSLKKVAVTTVVNIPTIGDYIFFYKNPVSESHGARGYYMRFKLENDNVNAVELFSVGSNVMKSYP